MKINSAPSDKVISNAAFPLESQINFQLSQRKSAKLLYMLRDGFYSYKIQTMVQEYMSNARDAHRSAKKENSPISVILPTPSNPSLIIKDFGTGMNIEQLTLFASYLESSKEDNDDDIGGIGIGGKMGFCYTDSFMILSVQDGVKYTVLANKLEDKSGRMNIASTEKTDEPNGVQVIIPIKPKDFTEVYRAVERCALFWTTKPIIENEDSVQKDLDKYNKQNLFATKNWQLAIYPDAVKAKHYANVICGNETQNSPFTITIGEIIYNLSEQILSSVMSELKGKFFMRPFIEDALKNKSDKRLSDFVIHFRIGELEIVGNREGITDRDSNIQAIAKRILEASKELEKMFYNKIQKELTPVEAINFILRFNKSTHRGTALNVYLQSFTNVERICLSEKEFYLNEDTNKYRVNLRRGSRSGTSSSVEKIKIILEKETPDEFYLIMKEELNPKFVKIKSGLIHQLVQVGSFSGYQIDDSQFQRLMKLGVASTLNSFPIEKADKVTRARMIDEENVTCNVVTEIIQLSASSNTIAKTPVHVSLKDIRKGIVVHNSEFNKYLSSLNKEDVVWINENKIKFYILGEKTLEKLSDKNLNRLDDIHKFLKKCDKFADWFFEVSDDDHSNDVTSIKHIFYHFGKEIIKSNPNLKLFIPTADKPVCGYREGRLSTLNGVLKQVYQKEILEYRKYCRDFRKNNPIHSVINLDAGLKKDTKDKSDNQNSYEDLMTALRKTLVF